MLPAVTARPRLIVCEDGTEYIDRFRKFLGDTFDFVPAGDHQGAVAAAATAAGLLLDLDFRRTPPERLIDERGQAPAAADPGTRRRLAETQGILILRQLRARAISLPALLFADIDDRDQTRYLERTLRPLTIVPSSTGLREVANLVRAALGMTMLR